MANSRPEPMNATSNHSKVKVSMTLPNNAFVSGAHITGRMEMECRADKGLGIGVMMVELFAIQELTSRDHSATSTFIHSRRLFQGPGLPPSNAVQPFPVPGEPPLPSNYHQARRGQSTFLFKFPLPASSPSSISFGGNLARVRYELRASVGVHWKGEKRLVTDRHEVQVVECYNEDPGRPEPEGVVVGENGKIWAQGKIVGGVVVAGESACVELQVKNHSTKKNTGLVITLTRSLVLSGIPATEKQPLQISDTLVTVPYRGQEYIIPPGAEGVASLVFDVPKHARGVRGGILHGDEATHKRTQSIFEVRCIVGIKMTMGIGTKDIELELPVQIIHPMALPELPPQPPYEYGYPYPDPRALPPQFTGYPAHPMSPPISGPYFDPQQGQVWLPSPQSYPYFPAPIPGQPPAQSYAPQRAATPVYEPLPLNLARPLSADGNRSTNLVVPGQQPGGDGEPEEGKGERAARVTQHLRQSTRNRSASPLSHRYPVASNPISITPRNVPPVDTSNLSVSPAAGSGGAIISPRPVLSPKTSFAAETPKSERVEELERMADEVALKTQDLSGDLPRSTLAPPVEGKEKRRKSKSPSSSKRSRSKSSRREKEKKEKKKEKVDEDKAAVADLNKTLPGPPVPTGKTAPPPAPRTRIDTIFENKDESPANSSAQPTPQSLEEEEPTMEELLTTPKTPTLTAMRRPPTQSQQLHAESGLDALERRLLQEVGTRKMPAPPRPDAHSVFAGSGMPVDIPVKRADSGTNDSAISSLTLAGDTLERERGGEAEVDVEQEDEHDRDSDERTQGAKKSVSGRTEPGGDGERRSGRKKEKGKESDPRKMRKAAKGRVAAWLGGIDPEAPPDAPSSDDDDAVVGPLERPAIPERTAPAPADPDSGTTIPNPRSSGFVPVNTFKRDPFQRIPANSPADEAKRIAELWGVRTVKDKDKIPPAVPQSIRTDRKVSPPSVPKPNGAWKAVASPAAAPAPKKLDPPPKLDPEVKYDIRSARGGRGGRVTAVASLWASGALAEGSEPAAPKPTTPADFLRSKPARPTPTSPLDKPWSDAKPVADKLSRPSPMIKSASVPAQLSSSLATPTLSSTASLARPTPKPKPRVPPRPAPTIAESASEVVAGLKGRVQASLSPTATKAAAVLPTTPKSGEMAFGQAKLRDLIKKYQGQTAA